MRIVPVLLALSVAAAAPLAAQQMPKEVPGKADPALVQAGTYSVDAGHTMVTFRVNHLGFSMYHGQFGNPSGSLVIDPKKPTEAKVDISFPIDSVSTTSEALDKHLKGADFFDAANHPAGRFTSTAIQVSGQTATITGNLTLKGVTRPVTLQSQFIGAGPSPMGGKLNIGFSAKTKIKRSDFGISYGIPMVSDDVDLVIDAAFVKA